MKLSHIIAQLGGQLLGEDIDVSAIAPAAHAQAHEITFLANPKYRHEVINSHAGAIIATEATQHLFVGRNMIIAQDAYVYFAQTARLFHPMPTAQAQIHPSAIIEPNAIIPASCEIGAHVYIGEHCVLGERCRILAGTVIEHGCRLGNDCVLHPNVTLYHGCTLGQRVEIHSGTVIGADGFGLANTGQEWLKIPQTGTVVLEDDVEIGANSNIDRGAMSHTHIGRGSKIDNQVQIGHNCHIGEHTVIAACTGISGSTTIGNHCIIGGAAMFVGHISIADHTVIGGGTAVTHSIKTPGHYATCYPMQTHKEWVKNAVHLRHLSQWSKRIKELEQCCFPLSK